MLLIVPVLAILVWGGLGSDTVCFPGCESTEYWSLCFSERLPPMLGSKVPDHACILCTSRPRQEHALSAKNSSQPASPCLPNKFRVGVRGFMFGLLTVQKLRPPQQSRVHVRVDELVLVECGITDVDQDTLAAFPRLATLRLDFNNLTHVKRNWFDGLERPQLHILSLSHNYITDIDSECFQKLTLLGILLLNDNALQSVHPSWFHKLEWLSELSLESNSIKNIHPDAFKSLSRLLKLDLRRNALTCLSNGHMKALHKLKHLEVSGNSFSSRPLAMTWELDYCHFRYSDQHVAVRVNEVIYCISKSSQLKQYNVREHYDPLTQVSGVHSNPYKRCIELEPRLSATSEIKYEHELPFIIISVNTESDNPQDATINHLCECTWKDVGNVEVALGGDSTLQIVPLALDKSHEPQIVAVVLSDVTAYDNKSRSSAGGNNRSLSAFDRQEIKNVTCIVNIRGKSYQHVFTTHVPSTPGGAACEDWKGTTKVTTTLKVKTTKSSPSTTRTEIILAQSSPSTTRTVARLQPTKARPVRLEIITLIAVVGLVLVALFVGCVLRKQRCRSRDNQAAHAADGSQGPPLAVLPLNRWMIVGLSSHVVTVNVSQDTRDLGTSTDTIANTQRTASLGDGDVYSIIPDNHYHYENTGPESHYWGIPDAYHPYENTRPASLHHYWEIPDDYHIYENTRRHLSYPLSSAPRDEDENSVRFYAAGAEVALLSSTRRGGKHPSYAHPAWARRERFQSKVSGCSYQQAQNVPIARSKGDLLTTYETGDKGSVQRTKTFSMKISKLKVEEFTSEAGHRRHSI